MLTWLVVHGRSKSGPGPNNLKTRLFGLLVFCARVHITLTLALKRQSAKLMMLPTDIALIEDKDFRPFVEQYAKDQVTLRPR